MSALILGFSYSYTHGILCGRLIFSSADTFSRRPPKSTGRASFSDPTFWVLAGRAALHAEGLPGAVALGEAPALGHFAGALLHDVLSTGGAAHSLPWPLGGALPLGARAPGAGEDPLLQARLLTTTCGNSRKTINGTSTYCGHCNTDFIDPYNCQTLSSK